MSLKNQTLESILWNSISYISLKIINFIISIILARLLEPSDFGVVGIALILINFFEIARDLGIGAALIYRKKDLDIAANTAFIIFPFIATVFYIISYMISPITANFFNNDDIEIVIKVLAITLVIWSFGNLPRTLLQKELKFKKLMIPQIIPRIGYGLISIVLALMGYGIWSLIIGRIVLEILSLITTWQSVDWRPTLKFDKKIAIELLSYGKYALKANVIAFIVSAVDIIVVGKYLGAENVGYYSMATTVSTFFTFQIAMIMSQVLFPVYSKINDNKKIGDAYLKTLKFLSLVTFPAAFGIMGTSWYFIKVILGDKWLPIVNIMQILCIYGLSKSIMKVTESIFLSSGNAKISSNMNFIQLVAIGILIIPFSLKFGIIGTGISVLIPSILTLYLVLREASKIIEKKVYEIIKSFYNPFIGSVIMFLILHLIHKIIPSFSPTLLFSLSIVMGMLTYFTYILITMKEEVSELIRTFKFIIRY